MTFMEVVGDLLLYVALDHLKVRICIIVKISLDISLKKNKK